MKTAQLKLKSDTGCPTKHDSWWIVLNEFFHNLLSILIQKRLIIIYKKYNIAVYLSKRLCLRNKLQKVGATRSHSRTSTLTFSFLLLKYKIVELQGHTAAPVL